MISVVITCYNLEDYISRCLESIIYQTHKNLEIIVINDYSTDNSLNIINEFIKKDSRIKVINNEKNYGAGKSRKIGIEAANGKYISLIDGDDYITENFLESLYNIAEKTDAEIVSGVMMCGDRVYNKLKQEIFVNENEKLYFLLHEKKTFINNKLIRKSLWDKVPYCERRYIEDTFPRIQLIYHCNKIVANNDVSDYYYYENRGSSLTHTASIGKNRLFMGLAYLDMYDFFQNYPNSSFNKIINKFSLKNGVGDFLNNKRIDHEQIKKEYPNEFEELMTRWCKLKQNIK
jgi:glycosyltransferase involved in cell wall biosynthesis